MASRSAAAPGRLISLERAADLLERHIKEFTEHFPLREITLPAPQSALQPAPMPAPPTAVTQEVTPAEGNGRLRVGQADGQVTPPAAPPQPRRVEPDPADELPWVGNPAWAEATGQPRRILQFMHGRDSVAYDVFAEEFWPDNGDRSLVSSALWRVNRLLRQMGSERLLKKPRDEPVIRWA
jgi:hypothetical protein